MESSLQAIASKTTTRLSARGITDNSVIKLMLLIWEFVMLECDILLSHLPRPSKHGLLAQHFTQLSSTLKVVEASSCIMRDLLLALQPAEATSLSPWIVFSGVRPAWHLGMH